MKRFLVLLISLFLLMLNSEKYTSSEIQEEDSSKELKLTQNTASGFAKLALKCVQKEYPNKLDHVMNNEKEVLAPSVMHPAFYGCFDWHSSVHGHWMLVG